MQNAKQLYKHWWKLNETFSQTFSQTSQLFDTNLTTTWFFKSQNYCDNERIFVIFIALKCADSALQYWLIRWKLYVIVDWCARCEIIANCWNISRWFWRMSRLRTWIFNWWKLSTLTNTNAKLIRILFDRSFALSDFNEYFFINCVLLWYLKKIKSK